MHRMPMIVIAAALSLAALPAAADGPRGPVQLDAAALDAVSAAGTVFIGLRRGLKVIFARTIYDVPVKRAYSIRETEIGPYTFVKIKTSGDYLIPPVPFPQ